MSCCSNTTHPPHPRDGAWAWLVLFISFLHSVIFGGIMSGYGTILPVLMDAFSENRERTALVGSLSMGLGYLLCVVATKLCERFTCRVVDGFGFIMNVLGFTLSSLCSSIYPMYLTYSVLTGIGGAFTLSATLIMLRKYFNKYYSFATGICSTGAGIGMMIIGPVVQNLTDSFGWRNTFRIFAGFFAVLCFGALVFDPNVEACEETSPVNHEMPMERKMKSRKIVLGFLDLSVWTFPEYTICVVGIFIGCWGHYTPLIHMIKYSEELGMSPTKSSTLLTFVGIATVTSRLLSGRLCDVSFIKPRYIHQAGIILSGISTILLTFATNYTHLVIFSVFYGIADGAFLVTIYILSMNTVDVARRASAFGQANFILSIANTASPAMGGMMADKSGNYTSAFYMAGSTSIVAGTIFCLHLCFFKGNTTKQEVVSCNIVDHPLACDGPASIKAEDASQHMMISMLDDIHKQRTDKVSQTKL